jgi:hypothetical protein
VSGAQTLDGALASGAEWLRDMAGVLFRLHALCVEGAPAAPRLHLALTCHLALLALSSRPPLPFIFASPTMDRLELPRASPDLPKGELRGLAPAHAQRLAAAVEAVFSPFERPGKPPPPLDPHYYGALYMQAAVPWLCAWRGGAQTETLAALVRRAGHALCRWLAAAPRGQAAGFRRRACERLHAEYAQLCSLPVWGGQEQDIVWKAFLA